MGCPAGQGEGRTDTRTRQTITLKLRSDVLPFPVHVPGGGRCSGQRSTSLCVILGRCRSFPTQSPGYVLNSLSTLATGNSRLLPTESLYERFFHGQSLVRIAEQFDQLLLNNRANHLLEFVFRHTGDGGTHGNLTGWHLNL